ncbi:MAG: hypothetical protein HQL25_03620 [Candidatus Omnitrophica bacterium]|nr:hypothetical protein [Candidatus Omnitrophota bacterium]
MKIDKVISRIRAVRWSISVKFGHSIERLGNYYMKLQVKQKNRLVAGKSPSFKEYLMNGPSFKGVNLKRDRSLMREVNL